MLNLLKNEFHLREFYMLYFASYLYSYIKKYGGTKKKLNYKYQN